MNLVEVIEKEHSSAQRNKVTKYVGKDPKRFAQLVNIFLKNPYRVTQRSAWPLSYCVQLHPDLIKPHLKSILQFAKNPFVHDSVKRNTMRLLQFIEIPKSLQGAVAELCFSFLQNTKEAIAIRVFAMTVLSNLTKSQPELKNELIPLIEDQMPFGSPGFVSRGTKILKELKRLS